MLQKDDWAVRFNCQLDNDINEYHEGGLRFGGDTLVLDYIAQHRHLLNNRPQCFGFDDYNIFNMMFSNESLAVIDFERYNICDPWEEFSDIVWSVKYSPHFATGQIRGYFGGEPPEEFWGLLALYISDYLLAFWKNQPITNDFWHDITLVLSQNVLIWFKNMTNPKPTWYLDAAHTDEVGERSEGRPASEPKANERAHTDEVGERSEGRPASIARECI